MDLKPGQIIRYQDGKQDRIETILPGNGRPGLLLRPFEAHRPVHVHFITTIHRWVEQGLCSVYG